MDERKRDILKLLATSSYVSYLSISILLCDFLILRNKTDFIGRINKINSHFRKKEAYSASFIKMEDFTDNIVVC